MSFFRLDFGCSRAFLFCCFFFIHATLGAQNPNVDSIEIKIKNVLDSLTAEGYPFSVVEPVLDSVGRLNLEIKKGKRYITFKPVLHNRGLKPHLFKGGLSPFRSVQSITSGLEIIKTYVQSLSFVDSVTILPLYGDGDTLFLPLEIIPRKEFFFNGAVGYGNQNGQGFTGDVSLALLNSFSIGESIKLQYRGDKIAQTVTGELTLPFLFSLPFIIKTSAIVEVQEAYSFTDIRGQLDYVLPLLYSVGVFFRHYAVNEELYGVTYNGIGVQISRERGLSQRGQFANFIGLNVESGYRESSKKRFLFKSIGELRFHLPVSSVAFMTKVYGGVIQVDEFTLNTSEKFRLGGLKRLRGYAAQSLPAVGYGVLDASVRYYINNKSYVYVLNEVGGLFENGLSKKELDFKFNYGLGLSYPLKRVTASIELVKAIHEPFKNSRININLTN